MSNPINPVNRGTNSPVNINSGKAQNKADAADSKTRPSSPSEDTVSLSEGSQQVIELQSQLKNAPEVDSAKVEAIKQEIARGNYPLDPEKIAENLINLEKSLLE